MQATIMTAQKARDNVNNSRTIEELRQLVAKAIEDKSIEKQNGVIVSVAKHSVKHKEEIVKDLQKELENLGYKVELKEDLFKYELLIWWIYQ